MLPAIPNALFLKWFDGWCRRALRRAFYRVHLYPDASLTFDSDRSHLYLANHSSFWDGIVLYHWLRARRRQPIYCMIDELQVREHPFFRRVGGFSVDRARPRDAIRSLDYAARLLNTSPASVIMFPQGEIRHNDARPLGFESGMSRIIRSAPEARIVTVALRYEFWKEQRAEVLLSARPCAQADLESAVEQQLNALKERALRADEGEILLQGQASISKWKRVIGKGNV